MNDFTSSPWSNGLVTMTIIGLIIIVGVIILLGCLYPTHSQLLSFRISFWFVIPLLVISILIAIAFMPRGVSVSNQRIVIHLLLKNIDVPAEKIEAITLYPNEAHTIRLFGIGGIFGNVGLFENEKIGKFDCYVTDFNKSYVIYRKNKRPIVVSVANPAIFEGYKMTGKEVK